MPTVPNATTGTVTTTTAGRAGAGATIASMCSGSRQIDVKSTGTALLLEMPADTGSSAIR